MKNERLNIHAPMLLLKRKVLNILRAHSAFCVCFVAFFALISLLFLACFFSVCFAARCAYFVVFVCDCFFVRISLPVALFAALLILLLFLCYFC